MYFGHTAYDSAGNPLNDTTHWQPLHEHLRKVASIGRSKARPMFMEAEAELAGLLHDLGKYAERFQERLRNPKVRGINHWAAGARYASDSRSPSIAFAIDGHHTGLPDISNLRQTLLWWNDPKRTLKETGCNETIQELISRFKSDGLILPPSPSIPSPDPFALAQRIRFLFSCLVDADFLDTEAHFQPHLPKERSAPDLDAPKALSLLYNHLQQLASGAVSSPVSRLRQTLLDDCLSAANKKDSLFTLTAPTGSGKTLSSLAFALKHVIQRNEALSPDDPRRLRRVIVVIPYTSIIEQTAEVYRRIFEPHFGPDYILEHHSSVDIQEPNGSQSLKMLRARLATENWSSPLIVTTSVQFIQSLFSNRSSSARKLHNIARSVVLFDEVQTLPPALAPSILSSIKLLTQEPYGASAVFMTATQPAFAAAEANLEPPGWKPVEISSNPQAMADILRRTSIKLPKRDEAVSWDDLAAQITSQPQALVVVNTTKDARELFRRIRHLNRGTSAHLSSRLCPAHRKLKLASIRSILTRGEPVHLVSTQLIEAGVDIDFPIAFRALGPLDSIIQTAGRCNREGNSATPCPVIVFRPIDGGLPPGSYSVAAKKTEEFLNRHPNAEDLLHDPEFYAQYFRELYNIVKGEDKVLKASKAFNFPLAYNECQVIDNNTQSVLVPWERGKYFISKLEREHHLKPSEYREAQKYSVNLYEGEFTNGRTHGFIYQPSDNADLFAWSSKYDEDLGACHPEAKDLVIA